MFRSEEQTIFNGLSFNLNAGDILVLLSRSGTGPVYMLYKKTTLLKCLSHLNVYQGDVLLRGNTCTGITTYITRVLYVPQRPSLLPSTQRGLINLAGSSDQAGLASLDSFSNATGAVHGPIRLAEKWGIDEDAWDRPWATLSGGESQRIGLAVAIGILGVEVLLLDEPTSALDAESMTLDEASAVKDMVWITHSEEQGRRVGTRHPYLDDGGYMERFHPPHFDR
ncbi:P-loop containing nucleoside triphosphate hydrolase protein [Hysterangium stoloniferum]|nr:P-loop containing nucleoside triphosphate hydrolase protein [Hysterangium stoloniferum]